MEYGATQNRRIKFVKKHKIIIDKELLREYTKKRGEDVSEVTPVPIPNTAVKLEIAEDS